MNAFALARRFLRWRTITTWLAVLSIALAVGMVIALRSLPRAIGAGAVEPAVEFPVIVGRGASASNVVLSVVFLDPPAPSPLPYSILERVRGADGVAEAYPIRIEHVGPGPIVSTVRAYFRLGAGRLRLAKGRFFEDREEGVVVVGSRLAAQERLVPGAFLERQGFRAVVVGVLVATGTGVDGAAFTPLGAAETSLSAIVVVAGERFDADAVARRVAEPGVLIVSVEPTLRKLVGLVAAVERIVGWIAWAIAALAVALVFSSLYSGARELGSVRATSRSFG